ncbi:MAG: hypothetical protein RLZZ122_204, partial [Actinomycetota bacterium]
DLITRLVSNALTNFRIHTPDTAICRVITKEEGASAQIIIEDSGPGLSSDFNYSSKARFRKDPKSPGTGLGMSIMYGIMSRHGGSLQLLQSDLGGLRIVATFPTVHQSPSRKKKRDF